MNRPSQPRPLFHQNQQLYIVAWQPFRVCLGHPSVPHDMCKSLVTRMHDILYPFFSQGMYMNRCLSDLMSITPQSIQGMVAWSSSLVAVNSSTVVTCSILLPAQSGQPEDVTDVDLGDRRDLLGQFSGTVRAPLCFTHSSGFKHASLLRLLQFEVTPINY